MVKLLLSNDAVDVNRTDTTNGTTPLFMSCINNNEKIVELLLANKNIDVNQALTSDGSTPLFLTCSKNNFKIVKLLLSNNASQHVNTIPF